uniref:Uncharacterized protein n=1 Tax=Pararge aegeria TaxID=116150 RepID=S4PVW4_9NEOP
MDLILKPYILYYCILFNNRSSMSASCRIYALNHLKLKLVPLTLTLNRFNTQLLLGLCYLILELKCIKHT